jgi:diadenosine tetraphosphate (Ap4A) HIT family hydrolase
MTQPSPRRIADNASGRFTARGYRPGMAETPEQLHARAAGVLRMPPVEAWESWPFDGDLRPRPLEPPVEPEKPRWGEDGVDCGACAASDSAYIWTSGRWRLRALDEPSGLPVVVLLEPRGHYDAPSDLPDDLAAELGVLLGRVERAVLAVDGVARVHNGRWGEGSAHLHWWFMGRPAGFGQLRSSFAAIWDDVLPPTPEGVWRDNLAAVAAALNA